MILSLFTSVVNCGCVKCRSATSKSHPLSETNARKECITNRFHDISSVNCKALNCLTVEAVLGKPKKTKCEDFNFLTCPTCMQCKYTRNVPLVFYVYFLDEFHFQFIVGSSFYSILEVMFLQF